MCEEFQQNMHGILTSFLQRDVYLVLKHLHLAQEDAISQLHFHLKRLQRCKLHSSLYNRQRCHDPNVFRLLQFLGNSVAQPSA